MRKTSLFRVSVLVLTLLLVLTMSVFAGLGNGNGHWKWSGGIHAAEFGGGHGFDKWFYGGADPNYVWSVHYELISGDVADIDIDDEGSVDYYYFEIDIDGKSDNIIFKATDDTFVLDPTDPEFLDLDDIDVEDPVILLIDKDADYIEGDGDDPDMTDDVAGFILNADIGELALSVFDNTLTDIGGELQLDVTSGTEIWDLNDDDDDLTEEDVRNTESLAYFSDTSGDDPVVADAEFILVLNRTPKVARESFSNGGYKYIPLRAAASSCKYECRWISAEDGILLTRGETEILIRLGDTEYTKDGHDGEFSAPPLLKNGKTFVPKEIIEIMDKAGKIL